MRDKLPEINPPIISAIVITRFKRIVNINLPFVEEKISPFVCE